VERLFAKSNVNMQRLQLLPPYIDLRGGPASQMCRAAFVTVDTEADARDIIARVNTGGPNDIPLSCRGHELSAAYWHADRPPHLAPLPTVRSCRLNR